MEDGIFKCFNYAKENELSAYDRGCHEIDAKRIFVNIVEYETVKPKDRFWEAHRQYLDVHLMLEGICGARRFPADGRGQEWLCDP